MAIGPFYHDIAKGEYDMLEKNLLFMHCVKLDQ